MKINKEKCIGCSSCEANYPGVFEMKEGKAFVKDKKVLASNEYIELCPVEAIEK